MVVDIDVLDEGEGNLVGYKLGKGFGLRERCMSLVKLLQEEIGEEGMWEKNCFIKNDMSRYYYLFVR